MKISSEKCDFFETWFRVSHADSGAMPARNNIVRITNTFRARNEATANQHDAEIARKMAFLSACIPRPQDIAFCLVT